MNVTTYEARAQEIFAKQDAARQVLNDCATELDAITYEAHVNGHVSVKKLAQIWDVVPGAIYIRLKRHRERNGL